MNETRPFAPMYGPSTGTTGGKLLPAVVVIGAATHTASTQLCPSNSGQYQLQIANKTSQWATVQVGVFGNVTAAVVGSGGYSVGPGGVSLITINDEVTGADVILDGAPSGSAQVVLQVGVGT